MGALDTNHHSTTLVTLSTTDTLAGFVRLTQVAPARHCEAMHKGEVDGLYRELGSRIAARRRELGLSQAQVAQRVHLTRASVSNVEAGRQRPQVHQLILIARALSLDPCVLLPAEEDIAPADPDEARHAELAERIRAIVKV